MAPVKDALPAATLPPARIGVHQSIAGGVHHALQTARELRCTAVQVFVKNQRQWAAPPLDPADVAAWHALRERGDFGPLVAHATYLVNLASPDRRLWNRSIQAFAEELRRCHALGIAYLVVHPGAATTGRVVPALARVARALDEIRERVGDTVTNPVLEITAGQGSTLGRTFDELAEIIAHVREPQRVGVCIDTCHVFATGHDLRTADGYAALLAAAERTVGLERIRCWHLNDSLTACAAQRDRHAHIGEGQIGSAGFRRVLTDPRFRGLPMILETPKGLNAAGRDWDRVNLARLRRLARLAPPAQ